MILWMIHPGEVVVDRCDDRPGVGAVLRQAAVSVHQIVPCFLILRILQIQPEGGREHIAVFAHAAAAFFSRMPARYSYPFAVAQISEPFLRRLKPLLHKGFHVFGDYSHSIQSNAFRLILVSPVRSRDSDSTDYLYSPCSTASVYHFFISVIKRLFCCESRGLFP